MHRHRQRYLSRFIAAVALVAISAEGARQGRAQDAGRRVPSVSAVVVTATRFPIPVDRVGSSISIITEQQIRDRQVTGVADILRTVPGLTVTRSGGVGTETQVRIRGTEANHTLVLIDGIEMNDPSAGSVFDFGHLLTSGVERIEVLRGPQSALYGSDAIGGVINIITKRGRGAPSGSVSVEGGSFQAGRIDAGVSGRLDRLDYSLYATGYHTDGISVASRKRGFSEQDGYAQRTAGGRLEFMPFDNLQIDLIGRWTQAQLETDGFSSMTSPNIAVDDGSDAHLWQRIGRIQGTLDLLDGNWWHVVGASVADTRRDFRLDDTDVSTFDGLKRKFDYQTDLFFASDGAIRAEHSTQLGVEYEVESVVNRSSFADVDRRLETTSVFGQQGVTLWDAFSVAASMRHDWNDLFEDRTTYRLSAAYVFEDGGRLRASYGTGVKAPTVFELFGFGPTFKGNPDLLPEESRGWDVGVEQRLFDGRVHLDLTYFDMRIENLITGFGDTAVNLPGTSRSRGIEVNAKLGLEEGIGITGSYTYMNAQDADGNQLVRRPRHLASITGTYRFPDDVAALTLGIDYNGRRQDLQFFPFLQPSTHVVLDSYTLVRVGATYRLTDRLSLFGRIENALNEQYEEVFSYGAPGRAAYVGLRATF